jgi:dnd system-associated protein 4
MPDIRIRIADNQAAIAERMKKDGGVGPFQQYTDVLAFAACYGMRHNNRKALPERGVGTEIAPIRMSVFESSNYYLLFELLAVVSENKPEVLATTEEMTMKRARIFEEFASGGLELLERELRAVPDVQDRLLLLLKGEAQAQPSTAQLTDDEQFRN